MSGKKKATAPAQEMKQLSLMDMIIAEQEQGGGIITSMLSMKPPQDVWRGVLAMPPGTLVEDIVDEFDLKTNIPLELPFFLFFHFMAGYLLHNNICLKVEPARGKTEIVQPDIWTVVLAGSGSGKTFTSKSIRNGIPDLKDYFYDIAGIASTARFVDDLQKNNRKLFVRDEFNELYKQLNGNVTGPLSELKDIFLRLYDNETITRKRRDDEIVIENAAIAFLGMTVTESFTKNLTADDIINGFAQRFSFIVAQKDQNKQMVDYPIYLLEKDSWNERWIELTKTIKYKTYISDAKAVNAFKKAFILLSNKDLDESFYRRQMWRAHKYALIYHILLGRGESEYIDPSCYGWAARMIHLLLQDCTDLLKTHGFSAIESNIQKVEALEQRLADKGQEMTIRDIVRHIRTIKSVSEAKGLLYIMSLKKTKIGGYSPSKIEYLKNMKPYDYFPSDTKLRD